MAEDSSERESSGVSDESFPSDLTFELLSNGRRRQLLRCLLKYPNPVSLPDLADEVAVWEHGTSIDKISAEDVKRVYMSLYHLHVPKLVDAAVVRYDQERDEVWEARNIGHVAAYLDSDDVE